MADDKPEAEGEQTFVSKQVARQLGIDGRKFRQFLRANGRGVGQGGRYEFTQTEVDKLKVDYRKWQSRSGTSKKAGDGKEPEKLGLNHGEDKPKGRSTPKPKRGDAREFPSDERTDEEIEEAFIEEQARLGASDEEELDLELDEDGLELDDDLVGDDEDDVEELEM